MTQSKSFGRFEPTYGSLLPMFALMLLAGLISIGAIEVVQPLIASEEKLLNKFLGETRSRVDEVKDIRKRLGLPETGKLSAEEAGEVLGQILKEENSQEPETTNSAE